MERFQDLKMEQIMPLCFFIFLASLLFSCNSKCTPQELSEYIQEEHNGLIKVKKLGDTEVELIYKPSDFLVKQELSGKESLTEKDILKAKENYNKGLYFTLNLSKKGQELEVGALQSPQEFSKRVQQLSFGMRERIHIKTLENDSIPLLDYIYPRMYGMTGKSTMLLVFDRAQATKGNWFDVYINGYDLGIGINKFRFQVKDIQQTPELDFNR